MAGLRQEFGSGRNRIVVESRGTFGSAEANASLVYCFGYLGSELSVFLGRAIDYTFTLRGHPVLDMDAVTNLDMKGAAVELISDKYLEGRVKGLELVIVNAGPKVEQLYHLGGTAAGIGVYHSIEEGLKEAEGLRKKVLEAVQRK